MTDAESWTSKKRRHQSSARRHGASLFPLLPQFLYSGDGNFVPLLFQMCYREIKGPLRRSKWPGKYDKSKGKQEKKAQVGKGSVGRIAQIFIAEVQLDILHVNAAIMYELHIFFRKVMAKATTESPFCSVCGY